MLQTVSPDNFKQMDQWGNLVFARLLADGSEVWIYVQNGIIQNGGLNITPLWHPRR